MAHSLCLLFARTLHLCVTVRMREGTEYWARTKCSVSAALGIRIFCCTLWSGFIPFRFREREGVGVCRTVSHSPTVLALRTQSTESEQSESVDVSPVGLRQKVDKEEQHEIHWGGGWGLECSRTHLRNWDVPWKVLKSSFMFLSSKGYLPFSRGGRD